jgi:hypothetical protein
VLAYAAIAAFYVHRARRRGVGTRVHIEKGYEGKRPRTWVNLTPAGEKALRDEIAHLKRLIQQVEQATP